MADYYPFDNEGSEDERAERAEEEEDEKALATRDSWFGIANSTGWFANSTGQQQEYLDS